VKAACEIIFEIMMFMEPSDARLMYVSGRLSAQFTLLNGVQRDRFCAMFIGLKTLLISARCLSSWCIFKVLVHVSDLFSPYYEDP